MNTSHKKVISLLLAFLLGFTSIGYSLDLHFCQGDLKSIAIIGKAKSCHEIAAHSSCHKKEDIATPSCSKNNEEKGCCSNEKITDSFEYDVVLDQNKVDKESVKSNFNKNISVDLFITISNSFNHTHYKSPDPPDRVGQLIRIVFCSFLC